MEVTLQNGETLETKGLSAEGLRLQTEIEVLPSRGTLRIPFQGYDISVPVVFKKGKATDFLRFAELESRSQQVIRLFHHGILTGEMASTEKVISRLDTPVDLIPMEETEEEAATSTPSRRRFLAPALFYVILAAVVFATLGGNLWTMMNTLPLKNAQVVAPLEPLMVRENGYIADVLVKEGDRVIPGQRIVAVSNPEAAAAIEVTRSDIVLAERRVTRLKKDLKGFEAKRTDELNGVLWALREETAQRRQIDFLSDYDLDMVRELTREAKRLREEPWPEDYDEKRIYQDLKNRLEEEDANLRQLRRALGRKKAVASGQDVKSGSEGTVHAVHGFAGQFAIRGTPVAEIERDELRYVEGIVTPARAARLYLGMPARISLRTADGSRGFDATITGFAAPDPDRFGTRDGMVVQITPDRLTIDKARSLFLEGAPVQAHAELGRLDWLTRLWRTDER